MPVWRPDAARPRTRLSWAALVVPVGPSLLVGWLLGPQGASVLTPAALDALDPALIVALAVIGVLIGLSIDPRRHRDRRWLLAGAVEATLCAAVVGGGLLLLAQGIDFGPDVTTTWAILAGVGASSSLALPKTSLGDPGQARRIRELDALLPIAAGAIALAHLRAASVFEAASVTVQGILIMLLVAIAAWLLHRNPVQPQARMVGLATLLLIGGAADYLGFSGLLGGLIAGLFWRQVGGGVLDALEQDAHRVRHPLVVLVLVTAGARAELTWTVAALAMLYAGLRVAGKRLGGYVAAGASPALRGLGLELLRPGVAGVALAVNALRAGGPDFSTLLAVSVFGTVVADLLAALGGSPSEGDA